MKRITVSKAAQDFLSVVADLELEQEEILLVRNRKVIARLVHEHSNLTALEVLGDLCGSLDEQTANELAKSIEKAKKHERGALKEFRNPWDS